MNEVLLAGMMAMDPPPGQKILTATGPVILPRRVKHVSMVAIGSGGDGGASCSGGACGRGGGGGGGGLAYLTMELPYHEGLAITVINGRIVVTYNGVTILSANKGGKGRDDKTGGVGGPSYYNPDYGEGANWTGGAGGSSVGYSRQAWGGGAALFTGNGRVGPYYGDKAPSEALREKGTSLIGPDSTLQLKGVGANGNLTINNAGFRIIWGEGRSYPNTNTEDM